MKKFKYNSIFLSLILLTACSGAEDQNEQIEGDLQTVVNEGLEKLEEEKPDILEYVDVLMCVFDSAGRSGFSVEQIRKAYADKLNINFNRDWVLF